MDLSKLKDPFPASDIEWRVQQSGISKNGKPYAMVLAYVTNRAIMDRLDAVCGPENWCNEYKEGPNGGTICGLSIKCESNGWVTKWDGADNTQIEAVKGGLSSAMKRAGSQWGVGRYLYKLDVTFANFVSDGDYSAKIDNKYYKWNPPKMPAWALPGTGKPKTAPQEPAGNQSKIPFKDSVKLVEKRIGTDLLKAFMDDNNVKSVDSLKTRKEQIDFYTKLTKAFPEEKKAA